MGLLFPAIYFAAAFKLLDIDQTNILFDVANLLAKGLFAQTALDCHIAVISGLKVEVNMLTTAAKQRYNFLKFLFHEVGLLVLCCAVLYCTGLLASTVRKYSRAAL